MPRVLARLLIVAVLAVPGFASLADSFTLHVNVPPPAPRVEVMTVAPSPAHFWVAGHWRWNGHAHVWVAGHWVKSRPNQVWVRDHWAHRGNEWFYYPGHWVKAAAGPSETVVSAPGPPPAVRVETVPQPPGAESFWVAGHWRWENNANVWVPGHWEARRVEEVWVPAHWYKTHGHWYYAAGYWRRV
jgi:hypothetical protein